MKTCLISSTARWGEELEWRKSAKIVFLENVSYWLILPFLNCSSAFFKRLFKIYFYLCVCMSHVCWCWQSVKWYQMP